MMLGKHIDTSRCPPCEARGSIPGA